MKKLFALLILSLICNGILAPARRAFTIKQNRQILSLAKTLEDYPELQQEFIEEMAEEMGISPEDLIEAIKIIARYTPTHLSGDQNILSPDNTKTQTALSFLREHPIIIVGSAVAIFILIQVIRTNRAEDDKNDAKLRPQLMDLRRNIEELRKTSALTNQAFERLVTDQQSLIELFRKLITADRKAGCLNYHEDTETNMINDQASRFLLKVNRDLNGFSRSGNSLLSRIYHKLKRLTGDTEPTDEETTLGYYSEDEFNGSDDGAGVGDG